MMQIITQTVQKQRDFFHTGKTRSLDFRIDQLKKLKYALEQNDSAIQKALYADFGKCAYEAYATEIALALSETKDFIRHLKRWAKPKRVPRSLGTIHAKNTVVSEPYGITLIMSPWNYPVNLTLLPLIGAMAAGNTAVIKPSRYVPETAGVLKRIIQDNFAEEYIALFEGGRDVNTALLSERYDLIFFTGGTQVGRVVMEAAAKNLTPLVLELGGKSPCIVDETANIKKTAKSICWGKFLNAGQTCIAPDYVMAHRDVKDALLKEMKQTIIDFYGEDAKQSPDFARIITPNHFERISGLISKDKVYFGGGTDAQSRYIAPTLLNNVTFNDEVMQQEIFGPVLPVITYQDKNQMIETLISRETPLALYVFSTDKENINEYLSRISSGDAVVNDTVIHSANPHLPFGGKGYSGMGSYHGKYSFETFSHKRSVVYRNLMIDVALRYAPYQKKTGWIRKLM